MKTASYRQTSSTCLIQKYLMWKHTEPAGKANTSNVAHFWSSNLICKAVETTLYIKSTFVVFNNLLSSSAEFVFAGARISLIIRQMMSSCLANSPLWNSEKSHSNLCEDTKTRNELIKQVPFRKETKFYKKKIKIMIRNWSLFGAILSSNMKCHVR